ncbi:MAG TPA: hypothetical protein ENG24_03425 [Thermoplasmatales archaeon]|nr:hypothetical protein [Thermoplasmatales archaeon]
MRHIIDVWIIFICLMLFNSVCFSYERIISLAPNITEMLYALDVDDKLVGVTEYSNYPPEAQNKPKVGTFIHPCIESIISLEPDLVLALENATPLSVITRLREVGIKVLVLKNGGLETIWDHLFLLGSFLNKKRKARMLIKRLKEKIVFLCKKVKDLKKPKVFWQIGIKPLVTCGKLSYHHELITLAGGINIVNENTAYCVYNLEKVLEAKPDVIIVSDMDGKIAEAFWRQFGTIHSQIYTVDSNIFDRPSPRVVEALKKLIEILHPNVSIKP